MSPQIIASPIGSHPLDRCKRLYNSLSGYLAQPNRLAVIPGCLQL